MKPRKACILIADDNPAIRSALALLLETRLHVHIVDEADSMETLLAGVRRLSPDIVILDWELPGSPRENRVAALKALHPPLKVVVTSTRQEIAQEAMTILADAYVCTCAQPELVVQAIQAL
jgi:DNA-binding NarL/FixJ family response regulator